MLVLHACVWFFFFFFKQKTAYELRISDWSSDVCSSDLCSTWNTRLWVLLCCGVSRDAARPRCSPHAREWAVLDISDSSPMAQVGGGSPHVRPSPDRKSVV